MSPDPGGRVIPVDVVLYPSERYAVKHAGQPAHRVELRRSTVGIGEDGEEVCWGKEGGWHCVLRCSPAGQVVAYVN